MHYFLDYKRKSIRLKKYNYQRSSHYFITICTKNKECLFGDIVEEKMVLNKWGNIIKKYWYEIPQHFSGVKLDSFVIMPNHIHAIVVVDRWDSAVGALHCNALIRDFANQNNQKCVETNIHVDDCVKNVIVDKRALQCNALPRDFANQNNQKRIETNVHFDDCMQNVIGDKRALHCNALPRDFEKQNDQKTTETNVHVDDCMQIAIGDKRALQSTFAKATADTVQRPYDRIGNSGEWFFKSSP